MLSADLTVPGRNRETKVGKGFVMFRQIVIMLRFFMTTSARVAPSLLMSMKRVMLCGGVGIRKLVVGETCQLNNLFWNSTVRCVLFSPRPGVSALHRAPVFPRQR